EQAADRFGAAASTTDHDDLAAGRRDARQCLNVRTVRRDEKVSTPAPFGDQRAGARGERLSLIAQHDHTAKGRFGFDRPEVQQRGGVDAAAPRRAQYFLERNAFRFEARADLFRIQPPPGAEVALRGAVVDAESRRVTEAT